MNVFFVFDDGRIVTPPLGGTILPGITRDSLIDLARDEGLDVREERYAIDQWRDDAASGKLVESFACGTAAVVTPIGRVASAEGEFTVGSRRARPADHQAAREARGDPARHRARSATAGWCGSRARRLTFR